MRNYYEINWKWFVKLRNVCLYRKKSLVFYGIVFEINVFFYIYVEENPSFFADFVFAVL